MVDFGVSGEAAEAEADGGVGLGRGEAEGAEDVGGFGDAGGAGGGGGGGEVGMEGGRGWEEWAVHLQLPCHGAQIDAMRSGYQRMGVKDIGRWNRLQAVDPQFGPVQALTSRICKNMINWLVAVCQICAAISK